MNLQQAAEQYAPYPYANKHTFRQQMDKCDAADRERSAFLAGASFSAQAFAEWCRKNYCTLDSHRYQSHKREDSWYVPGTKELYTTAELYTLYQQSLI